MSENFQERFIEARKEYIESRFPHLNSVQREAALATEGALLILAGAGSGKTTVLINRIYNILKYGCASDSDDLPYNASEEMISEMVNRGERADVYAALRPAAPWQILAITFTNKAAGELKARLENMLGADARDIWACTFHSACVKILRRDADRLGFTKNFTIYDTNDSLSLLKHIVKDMNLDDKFFAPRMLLNEISRAKDARVLPQEYIASAKLSADLHRAKIAEVYNEYMHRMAINDSMDFDDLILFTVMLLEGNEDVLEYWQNRFRYVLIDEYQDTNMLQYQFSALMAGGKGNICVVGDDDQSIYKFRGATIENILTFENKYRNCRTIRLEQNYRSTGHILNAANAVISNNMERKGKKLWTDKDTGDQIELYVADTEYDEAQYVASVILNRCGQGSSWKDFAVLYRKNAQSNSLEYALKRNSIPYKIVGGTRFFDRAEIKDVLSYMCVIASANDDLRLERIINNPPRGIGAKSIETAAAIAKQEDVPLFNIISSPEKYVELTRPAARMHEFANMIRELQSFAEVNTPDVLFDEILNKTGYLRMLEEKKTVEDTARAENVKELKSSIINYMKDSGDMTLNGYLANVALYTDLDSMDDGGESITLMTMHSSKGLEFPHVFITGMEETIFPSIQAIGESEEMEEERRLCYVAITRAMKTLNIVAAKQRMIFGKTNCNKVSRFVDEIPDEDIKKNIPKRYSYSERSNEENSFYRAASSYYSRERKTESRPVYSYAPSVQAAQPQQTEQFAIGDEIKHTAFGEGVIVKMTKMGNDSLIEINFKDKGNKKLMLRAAAPHMKKI